jgi:hypothetical protein
MGYELTELGMVSIYLNGALTALLVVELVYRRFVEKR